MSKDTDEYIRPSSSRLSSASRRKHDELNSHEISSKSPDNVMSINHTDEHSHHEEETTNDHREYLIIFR